MITKEDLKNGMIVETKRGFSMVLGEAIQSLTHQGGASLSSYNDDLTRPYDNRWDILKVYDLKPHQAGSNLCFKLQSRETIATYLCGKLLWERKEEVKEVTIDDLEKHYGCKVKIIK